LLEVDEFRFRVGKLLLSTERADVRCFHADLKEAREQAMISLAAASMESYDRAYPSLLRLHILKELEDGFSFRLSLSDTEPLRHKSRGKVNDSKFILPPFPVYYL
jgi:hypothetical protein